MKTLFIVSLVLLLGGTSVYGQTKAQLRKARKIRALLQLDSGGGALDADLFRGYAVQTFMGGLDYTVDPAQDILPASSSGCLPAVCRSGALPVSCSATADNALAVLNTLWIVTPQDQLSILSDYGCLACFTNLDNVNPAALTVRPVCSTLLGQ